MTDTDQIEWVNRLAQPRNEGLFGSLLEKESVSYEALAETSDRNVGALITQFSRWRSRGLDLLSEVKTDQDEGDPKLRGQGRPKEAFRLKDKYRPLISDVMSKLEGASAPEALEQRDSLPNLGEISDRLDKAHDENLDLSIRYYSAKAASARFKELLDFVSDTRSEHLGYQPSEVLFFRLRQGVDRAEQVAEKIRKSIAVHKIADVTKRHLSVLQHVSDGSTGKRQSVLSPYFGDMEERSVSGYGGALIARADGNKCSVLDDFLEHNFQSMDPLGGKMKFGFQHVVGEAIELAKIEEKWMPLTRRLLAGASVCPPLFELPGLRRTIESSLGKVTVTTATASRPVLGDEETRQDTELRVDPSSVEDRLNSSDFVLDAQKMMRTDVAGHGAQEQGGLMAKIHAASPSLAERIKAVVEPSEILNNASTM